MFSLTICFGPAATIWTMLFKEEEKAATFYDAYINTPVSHTDDRIPLTVTDDFGQRAVIDLNQIHSVMLEDMEVSQMAAIERGLHQARTQAKAQSRAMADPALKAAMLGQGPAVHSPFMNGRA